MEDDRPADAVPPHPPPVPVPLTVLPEHPCPYLPGRRAESHAFLIERMPGTLYHDFMDAGFRRSGRMVYQPTCRSCRACEPIRVPAGRFVPSKSQRRCARRNADLTVSLGPPAATDEKFAMYRAYLTGRHDGQMTGDRESFEAFLYESPVESVEIEYRDRAGRLLGVGICDVCERSVSSVYFYFDPAESRRGLGTFSVLYELALTRSWRIPHYYLGYWVRDCPAMRYKSDFTPNEILGADGVWAPPPAEARDANPPGH